MNQQDTGHLFETGLDRTPANFVSLSPVSFLRRSVASFRDKVAVIDSDRHFTYGQLHERCARLASALSARGVRCLDTVAILASNIPEMIEAHFAVPMLGAVLNPLNTRLDAETIAFSLNHGHAKVVQSPKIHRPGERRPRRLTEELLPSCFRSAGPERAAPERRSSQITNYPGVTKP